MSCKAPKSQKGKNACLSSSIVIHIDVGSPNLRGRGCPRVGSVIWEFCSGKAGKVKTFADCSKKLLGGFIGGKTRNPS